MAGELSDVVCKDCGCPYEYLNEEIIICPECGDMLEIDEDGNVSECYGYHEVFPDRNTNFPDEFWDSVN